MRDKKIDEIIIKLLDIQNRLNQYLYLVRSEQSAYGKDTD